MNQTSWLQGQMCCWETDSSSVKHLFKSMYLWLSKHTTLILSTVCLQTADYVVLCAMFCVLIILYIYRKCPIAVCRCCESDTCTSKLTTCREMFFLATWRICPYYSNARGAGAVSWHFYVQLQHVMSTWSLYRQRSIWKHNVWDVIQLLQCDSKSKI